MLIVISNPSAVVNEHAIINQLFDEGLEVLHVRKPDYSRDETERLLEKVNPIHYPKISLHQHHELIEMPFSRVHYPEKIRKEHAAAIFLDARKKLKTLSTSIHQIEDCQNLEAHFEYCFFGPVFNSISKPNYPSAIQANFKLPVNSKIKIIALGGMDEKSVDPVNDFGFSGMALLGAIWESKKPVKQFKQIKEKWLKREIAY